jgi:hypothetical protein
MTNFEIITESPVNLAEFLRKIENHVISFDTMYCKDDCADFKGNVDCTPFKELKCILKWLRQPEKENDDGK